VTPRTFARVALLVSCALAPLGALAQKRSAIELTRATIQANRHEIVQQAMDFTPAELEAFKGVYREWRAKVEALGDQKVKLIAQVVDGSESLTDPQAKSLTDEWLKIQTDELKLKKAYISRFRKILPEKKVARFFQLENKLDAALLYNLAGSVPLIDQ
jgi:hypothetical protein